MKVSDRIAIAYWRGWCAARDEINKMNPYFQMPYQDQWENGYYDYKSLSDNGPYHHDLDDWEDEPGDNRYQDDGE
jgi:hypothetical protein